MMIGYENYNFYNMSHSTCCMLVNNNLIVLIVNNNFCFSFTKYVSKISQFNRNSEIIDIFILTKL